ncbi:MAG TPA: AAA family ATPase [Acidiphilium sp.]|nr:MAG: hypothetical protein B7Z57_09955 [Acidiphilium sp. 37-60-79]OZB41349.1 MAG: hypothetical protein B7X48_01605 [Acidiphilium sp. 34-60-192]HQT88902.1 AAA family ATPase [Acidiphilium sp.]HQU24964.1 AAA family ATPase [Acidiphilium sp.]
MIYQIEVENFFSIKERQVIDLRVSGKVPDDFGCFAPIFPAAPTRAPKIVALFGANASGKTNVLAALAFVVHFFRQYGFSKEISVRKDVYISQFNHSDSAARPVKFALEFAAIMNATAELAERFQRGEQVPFGTCRYELELIMTNGEIKAVSHESLRQRPDDRGKWQRIFEREGQETVKGSPMFPIEGFKHLLTTLDPRESIVASFSQFNHPGAKYWQEIAKSVNFMIENHPLLMDEAVIRSFYHDSDMLRKLNDNLQKIDVGIDGMHIEMSGTGTLAKFKHNALEHELPWYRVSHGTRAFIRMYPLIAKTLETGGVAVIDELSAALHPLVENEILGWFRDPECNPRNAQLWCSGHAVTLMDDLRREEIIFCEKDRQGRTSLFGARDIARSDDNMRRKYLSGIYGAVPQIG